MTGKSNQKQVVQLDGSGIEVHKFGGSSLAGSDGYRRVGIIIERQAKRPWVVVVSASAGVTNQLEHLIGLAENHREQETAGAGHEPREGVHLKKLIQDQQALTDELLPEPAAAPLKQALIEEAELLADRLQYLQVQQEPPAWVKDWILGLGEFWSARLLSTYLASRHFPVQWFDARELLFKAAPEEGFDVDWQRSRKATLSKIKTQTPAISVVTGFVASDHESLPSQLGRNGSDYSASLLCRFLDARSLTIWSDVDGILSADPDLDCFPEVVPLMSFREVDELARLHSGVVHDKTIKPLWDAEVPIFLRNSFRPHFPGTRVENTKHPFASGKVITGVSDVVLIEAMIKEVTDPKKKHGELRARLYKEGLRPLVSKIQYDRKRLQVVVCKRECPQVMALLREVLDPDPQKQNLLCTLHNETSLVAWVGQDLATNRKASKAFFRALSKNQGKVLMQYQPSKGNAVMAVLSRPEAGPTLRHLHEHLMKRKKTLQIILLGTGLIGSTFLEQLHFHAPYLKYEYGLDLRVTGIANSRLMLANPRGIDLGRWEPSLEKKGRETDLKDWIWRQQNIPGEHKVIVDATSSERVASLYGDWLAQGFDIIAANKKAGSGDWEAFHELLEISRKNGRYYLYETTVGAGLPILDSVKKLQQTGDTIFQLNGILSGTLSWIFGRYDGIKPFSQVLRDAHDQGLTEPDPRDDLAGLDVARKLVILARECGFKLSLEDCSFCNLVPEPLRNVGLSEFWTSLPEFDGWFAERLAEARAQGQCLRYVAKLSYSGEARIGLEPVSQDHIFSRIHSGENIIEVYSSRYRQNPLIVMGPGAGPDVTSAGVFADIFKLAERRGLARIQGDWSLDEAAELAKSGSRSWG